MARDLHEARSCRCLRETHHDEDRLLCQATHRFEGRQRCCKRGLHVEDLQHSLLVTRHDGDRLPFLLPALVDDPRLYTSSLVAAVVAAAAAKVPHEVR